MKLRLLPTLLILGLLVAAPLFAQTPTADLNALVTRIKTKLGEGKRTAADFAEELASFETLRAKYQDQKTDDVAQILFMQATLHGEVFEDAVKAKELFTRLKTDFPDSKQGKSADQVIAALEARAQAAAAQQALVGQPAPELHFKWSNRAGLTKLSELKGKVVVLDFWATWCGPCVASFPNVRELAAQYQGTDVVIVGVTSLQGAVMGLEPARIDTKDDPKKEFALMTDYIKAKNITWTIAFSDEPVFNPAYGITGIPHMAIIAPDGTVRHTGLHPAMPHAEKQEKINAILKEFGKVAPATSPN